LFYFEDFTIYSIEIRKGGLLPKKGAGLGMMVVFGVMKTMRGTISFNSKPGKGTSVSLRFPGCEREQHKYKNRDIFLYITVFTF
jgi:K+-sensing histidine kinase KdpD